MNRIVLLFCFVLLVNCQDNKLKSSRFLQSEAIRLALPKLTITNRIIDSTVTVNAALAMENVSIHYTENGEEPSTNSKLFEDIITISEEKELRFKAFHDDWLPSEIRTIHLFKKGISPKYINMKSQPSSTYPGVGNFTLCNDTMASLDFKDNEWQGFDTKAIGDIIFDKPVMIKKLSISYLVDSKSWIFPPEKVEVILNKKDTLYTEIPELKEDIYNYFDAVVLDIDKTVEIAEIKVVNSIIPKWHPGTGHKAWLFMDEWIFNEK